MKVENQAELEKLIKLLRKMGVEAFKSGEIELKLSPEVPPTPYQKKKSARDDRPEREPTVEEKLLEDQKLLFWSSTPPGLDEEKEN